MHEPHGAGRSEGGGGREPPSADQPPLCSAPSAGDRRPARCVSRPTAVPAAAATMGPWGEPELLVWRPEAVGSEPAGPVGLEVKVGALVLLLLLTALCSLVPVCALRRPGANPEASGEPLGSPLPPALGLGRAPAAEEGPLGPGRAEGALLGAERLEGVQAHSRLCSPVQPPGRKP